MLGRVDLKMGAILADVTSVASISSNCKRDGTVTRLRSSEQKVVGCVDCLPDLVMSVSFVSKVLCFALFQTLLLDSFPSDQQRQAMN